MSYKSGVAQKQIYANCRSLEEVISASCLTKIRMTHRKLNGNGSKQQTTPERVWELFTSGVNFNWSNGGRE